MCKKANDYSSIDVFFFWNPSTISNKSRCMLLTFSSKCLYFKDNDIRMDIYYFKQKRKSTPVERKSVKACNKGSLH